MVILQNNNKLSVECDATYAGTNTALSTQVKNSGIATGLNLLNIPAAKVTSDIDLTVRYDSTEYKGTVNAASFIGIVLNGSGSEDLKNVMTALYYYNQAAVAFFPKEGNS